MAVFSRSKSTRTRLLVWEMLSKKGSVQIGPKNVVDYDIDDMLDGRPLSGSWERLECSRPRGFRSKQITDVVQFAPGIHFALSERAVDGLYDLIENDAELLPLDVEGKKYWLMYVTSMLACVDYEASEFQVYPDGRIGSYDALSFIPDAVEGHNLFKLSDRPFGFVYTSNAFKERAESIDAIGSRFVLVWDSSRSKPIELPLFH